MNICIVGWYGTETMGDIAILDGILSVIDHIDNKSKVLLGSLYPFYTERTLYEEREVFKSSAPNLSIKIFDIKEKKTRDKSIAISDLIIMGGGPLMDLDELYIIKKCFRLAYRKGIPTIIMGCGIGPLIEENHIKCVKQILDYSTLISFRDNISLHNAKSLFGDNPKYRCLGDPAIISIENYKKKNKVCNYSEEAIVNMRQFPNEYGKRKNITDDDMKVFLMSLSKHYSSVRFIPMHTFCIGGDDRRYAIELLHQNEQNNIFIQQKPMNLHELYAIFAKSKICIGMRYHAVVMQTIINGNNYILDYTNQASGKISSFIREIDKVGFYNNRIFNLQKENSREKMLSLISSPTESRFSYQYSTMKEDYISFINELLNR